MAQNVQNVTLSLTLPITCHICLGKVRQPVICINNHVFCSVCIDVWLKNNNQCPACRVAITPENPCKEIIGGTSESEPMLNHTVRKHLRKTRLELLHKEYEDEIECLQKEVEELRGQNLSLESHLKTVLSNFPLTPGNQSEGRDQIPEEKSKVNPETVAEWKKELRTANDIYEKVKDDVEKLKEANKKLKLENGSLVRENLRLKAEVDNRSPQKFGRFTVAALQSKVEQYERETSRLKKALERSDKYIEELESQVLQLKNPSEEMESSSSISQRAPPMGGTGDEGSKEAAAAPGSPGETLGELPVPSSQSPPPPAQAVGSGQSEGSGVCVSLTSPESSNEAEPNCDKSKELFPDREGQPAGVADPRIESCLERQWGNKSDDGASYKDEELYDLPAPSTPSLSLSCLQLNTPDNQEGSLVKAEGIRKHANHLRKLVFDDFCGPPGDCVKDPPELGSSSGENGRKSECFNPEKSVFWDCCPTNYSPSLDFESSEPDPGANPPGELAMKANEKTSSCLSKRLHSIRSFEINRTRTSSEASMDAAYLDKISELDSMMSESDNSKSPYNNSFKSVDLDTPTKAAQCSEFLEEVDKKLEERTKSGVVRCSLLNDQSGSKSEWKPASFFILSPTDQEVNENFPLFGAPNSGTSEFKPQNCLFQREFSQGFLLSNSPRLFEDQKLGSSFLKVSSELHSLHNPLQSPWAASFIPEKRSKSVNQSAKRKIQNSLSSASPSKATKN
ncbi:ORC ubiquitin ligase 1 [Ornithorhynchus anatinus]|uniref:ORC ubiquitin ligase 1 n=1 Tax=Ornithorhynchus anatinus TaxID=9258 RepID=F6YE91_ORNAN|nr:ORC ubiquitin ligase 1 [Ornithorhynchus anatinus]